jgi:hypothetical protein
MKPKKDKAYTHIADPTLTNVKVLLYNETTNKVETNKGIYSWLSSSGEPLWVLKNQAVMNEILKAKSFPEVRNTILKNPDVCKIFPFSYWDGTLDPAIRQIESYGMDWDVLVVNKWTHKDSPEVKKGKKSKANRPKGTINLRQEEHVFNSLLEKLEEETGARLNANRPSGAKTSSFDKGAIWFAVVGELIKHGVQGTGD